MQNHPLSDAAALAEAKRLLLIITDQRSQQNALFGFDSSTTIPFDPNCAWSMGMCALFRYARGAAIPACIVQDFLEDLLQLMFCGLANPTMALPPFKRMADKPWAYAWRLAELRLALEHEIEITPNALAHLLGISTAELEQQLMCALPTNASSGSKKIPEIIPDVYLRALIAALREELEKR